MRRPGIYMVSSIEGARSLPAGLQDLWSAWVCPLGCRLPEVSGVWDAFFFRPTRFLFRSRSTGLPALILLLCLLTPMCLPAQEGGIGSSDTETMISPADSPDQDPDAAGLTYGSAEYAHTLRAVPDSTVKKLQQERDFRYANDPSYWGSSKKRDDSWLIRALASLQRPLAQGIIYLLLGALVLFILYQALSVNNLLVFSRSSKRKKDNADMPEELMAEDLDKRVGDAIGNNDLRLAVRYLYLQTLQALGQNNFIRYNARTTNQDYVQQMRSHPGAVAFHALTQVYEYVWYGEFEPGREQFERIREDFKQFMHSY